LSKNFYFILTRPEFQVVKDNHVAAFQTWRVDTRDDQPNELPYP